MRMRPARRPDEQLLAAICDLNNARSRDQELEAVLRLTRFSAQTERAAVLKVDALAHNLASLHPATALETWRDKKMFVEVSAACVHEMIKLNDPTMIWLREPAA